MNTLITPIYLPFCVCVREHLSWTTSKFQLYKTVLTAVGPVLHVRFEDLLHLRAGSLCPFTTVSLSPSAPRSSFLQPLFYPLSTNPSFFPQIPHRSEMIEYLSFSLTYFTWCITP